MDYFEILKTLSIQRAWSAVAEIFVSNPSGFGQSAAPGLLDRNKFSNVQEFIRTYESSKLTVQEMI
jgi:hypothetical protein